MPFSASRSRTFPSSSVMPQQDDVADRFATMPRQSAMTSTFGNEDIAAEAAAAAAARDVLRQPDNSAPAAAAAAQVDASQLHECPPYDFYDLNFPCTETDLSWFYDFCSSDNVGNALDFCP